MTGTSPHSASIKWEYNMNEWVDECFMTKFQLSVNSETVYCMLSMVSQCKSETRNVFKVVFRNHVW